MSVTRLALLCAAVLIAASCSSPVSRSADPSPAGSPGPSVPEATVEPAGVYGYTQAGALRPEVASITPRVYVPNSGSNTLDVIDPVTMSVVKRYKVGKNPQHVTPSWDMRTLYVDNDLSGTLTPIDAATGKLGAPFPVTDPYNLYFTPDGRQAIVVAEAQRELAFRDPATWKRLAGVKIPFRGPNHLDFSPDGRYLIVSCEFSGRIVKVDTQAHRVVSDSAIGGKPVDVRIAPDASVFFVANETRNGVSVVDPQTLRELAFVPTGKGTHGFVVSRDGTSLYVTNRLAGTVSVFDMKTRSVTATWTTGGSPDMGGVSVDGSRLWLSGRYDSVVYVLDTATGQLIRKIRVGRGPHGVDVFPQPGRYSLGHTGNYR